MSDAIAPKLGQLAVALMASAALGFAVASSVTTAVALVAPALLFVALAGALLYPEAAFVVLVLILALVPPYAAPELGHVLLMPAAGAAWLLVGVLIWRRFTLNGSPIRLTAVDIAVGIFALLMATSVVFSPQVNENAFLELVFTWGGVYLAARLLLRDTQRPVQLMAVSFALATVILAPVAFLEAAGKSNPFLALQFNPTQSAVWAKQASRFGQHRAEASFGHPIALSMFAATSALLSLAVAVNSERMRTRLIWFVLALLAVGVQVATLSRTGWVLLVLGVFMLALVTQRGPARRRFVVVISILTVAVVTLFALSPSSQLQLLSASGINVGAGRTSGSGEVERSGAGRDAELSRALTPGILQAWGSRVNRLTPAVESGGSLDNEYILLAEEWGLIPMASFILVACSLVWVTIRARSKVSGSLAVLPIVAFLALIGLVFVAFITQQQMMIWLLLGGSGAIAERMSLSPVKDLQLFPHLNRT